MNTITRKFNYASLDAETRLAVEQKTTEIRDRMGRAAQNIFEMGQRFADVKAKLQRGRFEEWLEAEFPGMGRSSAYRMIQVYERLNRPNLGQFDSVAPSALYLLASDSTPEPIREQFIEQAKSGNEVTHREVKTAVDKSKSKTPPPSKPEKPAPQPATPKWDRPEDIPDFGETPQPATPQPEPPTKAEPEPTDEVGVPLPGDAVIRDAFARSIDLDRLARQLTGVRIAVTKAGDADPLYTFVNLTRLQANCNEAARILRDARPHAVCPFCKGDKFGRKSCRTCKGVGWINRERYDQATPSEMKG